MDVCEKEKLKVMVKLVLLHNYPKEMTANQIANFINLYTWGFRSPVTSKKISKLLYSELSRSYNNFMDDIVKIKGSDGVLKYKFKEKA